MDKINILLVDDRPENLLVLEAILESLDQNLIKAQTGEAALQLIEQYDFALILLDVNLPGIDGYETATHIHTYERSKDVPIIFLTAYDAGKAYVAKGYAAGAVDYIIKPIVAEILKAKVSIFVDLYRKTQLLRQQLHEIQQLHRDVDVQKRATAERQELLEQAQTAQLSAEASQRRMSFLAEASALLSASLEYEAVLKMIARLCLPTIADACVINMVDADGNMQNLITTHVDPLKERIAQQMLQDVVSDPEQADLSKEVLRTGQPILIPDMPDEVIESIARDEEQLRLLRSFTLKSVMFVPLTARGSIIGVLSLYITEREHHYGQADLELAQELARRAAVAVDNAKLYAELQQAIQDRDNFLSVAAHELKTPVTNLQGFAQVMLRRINKHESLDSSEVQHVFLRVNQQSEKLGQLISHLLDISRIRTGNLSIERKPTDIVALVQESVANFQMNSTKHKLVLSTLPSAVIEIDPLRIEQVLLNLIDNAVKYSPDGGVIRIEIAQPEPAALCITVTDQGLGIPPEERDQLFQPFYRAHANHHISGMGLGLYISRQIIELHGGEINIEFPSEGGTRFVIQLQTSS